MFVTFQVSLQRYGNNVAEVSTYTDKINCKLRYVTLNSCALQDACVAHTCCVVLIDVRCVDRLLEHRRVIIDVINDDLH